jgi:hypothetical protein
MPSLTHQRLTALIAIATLLPARAARAQQAAPAPCKVDSTYRKFDFWVGTWTVTPAGATQVGTSHWNGSTISFFVDVPATNGRPKATMRLSFTPLSHDEVRQHSEISTDAGKTWKTQYDFHYRRAP